jgi:hypothetical protein
MYVLKRRSLKKPFILFSYKASNLESGPAISASAPSLVALNLPTRDQGKAIHNQTAMRMGPPVSAHSGTARDGLSFAKLNAEDSDDIGDFDEGQTVKVSSELGKRDRLDSPGKTEQNEAARPTRRLVRSLTPISIFRVTLKCATSNSERCLA